MSAVWVLPEHPKLFATITGIHFVLLVGICYWKGESPKRRWGGN